MNLKTLAIASLALLALPSLAQATPVAQYEDIYDTSGNPASGVTFTVNGTPLVPDTPTTVTASAESATSSASVSITITEHDYGTGHYKFAADNNLIDTYVPLVLTKTSTTFASGGNVPLNFPVDPALIAGTNTNTGTLLTGQTTLQTTEASNGTAIGTLNTLATTGTGVKIAAGQSVTASNFVAGPTVAQIAAGLPTDATIQADAQAGSYAALNLAGPTTPTAGSLFGMEAADQASSAAAANTLAGLVSGGKFTAAALSLAPTSSGGVGGVTDASVTADVTSALAGGVTLKGTEYTNIANAVSENVVANGLTNRQAAAVNYVYNFGPFTRTKTATTQTLTWPAVGTLPGIVSTSNIDSNGSTTGRTNVTFSNLPN